MASEERAITHEHLISVCKWLPQDYAPYGQEPRWADPTKDYPDCSVGCKWFAPLKGTLGFDWGVCSNPASHRCGLLTFEHQGCLAYEPGRWDSLDTP